MANVLSGLMAGRRGFLLKDFATFCIGTRVIPDFREQPHREMCDELGICEPDLVSRRNGQKKEIYLAPRHSYKTSILSAWMVYLVLKYPNIRIVFGRATAADAKKVLFKVKQVFQSNSVILDVWGDVSKGAPIWADDQIIVNTRTEQLQEPTIGTTGLGASLTGLHPDVIILDDLVNDVNYMSQATLERSRTLLDSALPVLPPHGSIVVCGTRWAYNDVYGWLMSSDDNAQEEEVRKAERENRPARDVREWRRYIRSAYLDNGELFFPGVLSEEFLDRQRRSLRLNMMLFSSWYYNQPFEEGTKLFPKNYIKWDDAKFYRSPGPHLEFADGRKVPLYVTMTIDPAPTTGPHSDFTGVVIVGSDHEAHWYVLWAEGMKKVPSEGAHAIVDLVRVFAPAVIGIETGQADPELVARVQAGLRDLDLRASIQSYSPIQDEKRGERGKTQRIEALEPLFRADAISFIRGAFVRDLLVQLDGFPSLDHDDVIDALAMQRLFVRACKQETIQEQVEVLAAKTERQEEIDSWGPEGPPQKIDRRVANIGRGSPRYF